MVEAEIPCHIATFCEEDRSKVERFFSEVWMPVPQQKSERWLDWKWQADPNAGPDRPTVLLAHVEGEVVGILVLVPTPLFIDGVAHHVAWGRDLYVDPRFRRYKIGLALNRHWTRIYWAALGSGQSGTMRNLQQKYGWQEIARVRQYEKLFFDPQLLKDSVGEGLQKVAKRGLAMLFAAVHACKGAAEECGSIKHRFDFDERVEPLWLRCRDQYPRICSRDLKTLRWRFSDHPYFRYDIFELVNNDGAYAGYLVTRQDEKTCWFIDLLTDKDDLTARRALLRHAEGHFRSRGVTRFVCRSVCAPLESALASLGYLPTTFEQYACTKSAQEFPPGRASDWYITAMDSDLDR